MVASVFERPLDGFEVFAGELVGESEERLFLVERVSSYSWGSLREGGSREEDGSQR